MIRETFSALSQLYLDQHVTDLFVPRLGCGVERSALVLSLHLEVGVDAVHCDIQSEGENLVRK